ncbi:MAG TPA: hypothetical protein VKU02_03275, partial [Gemmataceae bacterium]|nr:hypothetical protein [Gemmataceae bacterium]
MVRVAGTVTFVIGCFSILFFAIAQNGQLLYNGILLPSPWPTLRAPTQAFQLPGYIASPPTVIPIDVGRQLFVDDFLVESTSLTRTPHRPGFSARNPILTPLNPPGWDNHQMA